jgi:hypothetical protein
MAARRASPGGELLRPGRPGRHDPDLHGVGAHHGREGPYAGTRSCRRSRTSGSPHARAGPGPAGAGGSWGSKPGNNALAQAFRDNLVLDYAGIRAAELDAEQRALLVSSSGSTWGRWPRGTPGSGWRRWRSTWTRPGSPGSGRGPGRHLLLPDPEPRHPHRVRPPAPGGPGGPREPDRRHIHSWSGRRTGTTTERIS